MSLVLLIDGYNLAQPLGPGRQGDPRWLERSRTRLMNTLVEHLPLEVRTKTCVVFDAANPPRDRSDQFTREGIEIRFAVGYPTADDLLEELIRAHHTPKKLMVVSSDHRVQTAARRRHAKFSDSEPWMDDLTDGVVRLAAKGKGRRPPESNPKNSRTGDADLNSRAGRSAKPKVSDADEVDEWMRKFGFGKD